MFFKKLVEYKFVRFTYTWIIVHYILSAVEKIYSISVFMIRLFAKKIKKEWGVYSPDPPKKGHAVVDVVA